MENNTEIFEEQPQAENLIEKGENGSSSGEFDEIESKTEQSKAERGVPVGKFKSVDDLYQAYNNLQSEFTRKCQKLSELEKDKTSQEYSQEKFDENFREFLLKHQEAYSYAEEIKNKVLNNADLKTQERPFETVWAGMLYEKLTAQNKAEEPLVQKFIMNDENLKNLVIQDYMKQLQGNKTPFVMASETGERVTKTVAPKPDSFEQAKKMVLDLLS